MTLLFECKNLFLLNELSIYNEQFEPVGIVRFTKDKEPSIAIELFGITYLIENNRLQLRNRYIIYRQEDVQAKLNIGIKILHSMIEQDKYYFVKASFFTLHYSLYDDRELIGELVMHRIDDNRYYYITNINDDIVQMISLFLLAHAVRIKAILTS